MPGVTPGDPPEPACDGAAGVLRAVVADDEPLARRGVRQLLASHPDVTVVAEARNGREALDALHTCAPDLLFLDVEMPDLDGFGVLRAYEQTREHARGAGGDTAPLPAVIFVTAYDAYAVRAFDRHALDYLVKPLEEARFADAVARVRERLRERRRAADADDLTRRLAAVLADRVSGVGPDGVGLDATRPGVSAPPRVVIPTASGHLVLDAAEIDWIEADDYYAAVHARGRRHLVRESLGSLARRFESAGFVRVHRAALVNGARVREWRAADGAEAVLVLRDGSRVPVSRRRREQVAALLRRVGR